MTAVRLTHIDGKLPNLALMKLAHWHKSQGHNVVLKRSPQPDLFETRYDQVYASSIFRWSLALVERHRAAFPETIVGGTGANDLQTVESQIGVEEYEHYDYSIYPEYPFSLGFTQRGCRLNCGFCVVPKKEGRPRSLSTIKDIWRYGTPKCVVLLDNDFFGQAKADWQARIAELKEGGFKVCFNQGVNARLLDEESASALASVRYYDDQFTTRRLYTAWDNLGQEKVFFHGLDLLKAAGVKPAHVMVYMLIGYAPDETMERILYRYQRLKDVGCMPYPMVYNRQDPALRKFQRWVIRRYDEIVPWEEFNSSHRAAKDSDLMDALRARKEMP